MIKCKLLFALIFLCTFCTIGIGSAESEVEEIDGLMLVYNNVKKIDINADGPSYLEHQKYNYSTSSKNEIAYILNYINNFNLEDDGEFLYANDVSSYSVKFYMTDGDVRRYGFYSGRFYDNSDKQYAIDIKEYNRFLDFIYALKTEKIVLADEVTLETSEWAKGDIDKAVNKGLVPGLNQIGYSNNITRVEVCQLIDNFLSIKGVDKEIARDYTYLENYLFNDTKDVSVKELYIKGIIIGKSEKEFCPYDCITREEFAKILSNTCEMMQIKKNINSHIYADQSHISDWAKEDVDYLYQLDIMSGKGNNEFKPKDTLTKEEAIVAILRLSMFC